MSTESAGRLRGVGAIFKFFLNVHLLTYLLTYIGDLDLWDTTKYALDIYIHIIFFTLTRSLEVFVCFFPFKSD